jgi:hypothetical protein
MNTPRETKIDLIMSRPDGTFALFIVEEGPWENDITTELYRLQTRLYDYIDIAIDGHLAEKFPKSKGQQVIIKLDCYATPENEVKEFFERFVLYIEKSPKIQRDIKQKGFIQSLAFEYNRRTLQDKG